MPPCKKITTTTEVAPPQPVAESTPPPPAVTTTVVVQEQRSMNTLDLNNPSVVAEIKMLLAPTLNPNEFGIFLNIAKSTGLNPFLREIFAVKYNQSPAMIIIARDGYRKSAQQNPDYEYHQSDAIYSGDTFRVEDGVPKHVYAADLTKRGTIVGAYSIVKRKSAERSHFQFVEFKEYCASSNPL